MSLEPYIDHLDLTRSQARALAILEEKDDEGRGMCAREFAKAMWPKAEGWKRHTQCGPKGVTAGGGMNLAGGSYLGKLDKAGLVTMHVRGSRDGRHSARRITELGRRSLEKWRRIHCQPHGIPAAKRKRRT